MKRFAVVLALVVIAAMMLPAVSYAAAPAQSQVPADVEILKKATGGFRDAAGTAGALRARIQVGMAVRHDAATGDLGAPVTGNRYAVVIGITDYPGADMDLKYAANDAYDVRDTLIGVYGFPAGNVIVLVDGAATRDAVVQAIAALKNRVRSNDEVFFFYSGHGAKSKLRNGPVSEGIVLWGSEQPQPYVEVLWDRELKRGFDNFRTDRIVFAFDMCYAGGLNQLSEKGRIVLMATDRNGIAAEVGADEGFPEVNNGLFTYFLMELGMGYGLADLYDNDNNPATPDVTVEEAFDFAKANLLQLSLLYQDQGLWEIPVIYDRFKKDMLL